MAGLGKKQHWSKITRAKRAGGMRKGRRERGREGERKKRKKEREGREGRKEGKKERSGGRSPLPRQESKSAL
jgi:hypothetical protein